MELTLETILVKALEKSAETKGLLPGTYKVDTTVQVHVSGTIKKGHSYESTPTVRIPHKLAMALFLEKSGITREAASAMLVEAMQEALAAEEKGEEYVAEKLKNVAEAEARVSSLLGKLPKIPCDGRTTCALTAEVLASNDGTEFTPAAPKKEKVTVAA